MPALALSSGIITQVEEAVDAYSQRRQDFVNLADRVEKDLIQNAALRQFIHSTKWREKDPVHLRDKLCRMAVEAKSTGKVFDLTAKNLFREIGDLAGVRLLHIHTDQLRHIHPTIMEILARFKYELREDPIVYIWDMERQKFFEGLGLKVVMRPLLYTSVHYVIQPHWDAIGCELQVRTLAEELWGEVSHSIDYPYPTESVACREQLAALARIASGCTRLVDSIFASHEAFNIGGAEKKRSSEEK